MWFVFKETTFHQKSMVPPGGPGQEQFGGYGDPAQPQPQQQAQFQQPQQYTGSY